MRKSIFAAASAALVAAFATGAAAHVDTASHVETMSASAGANNVAVSGTATFIDVPALVGEDGSGDAFAAGFGMDMTTVKMSRTPGTNTLKFTLGIADQPPVLFGIPEVLMYQWDLAVGAPESETKRLYKVSAGRTGQGQSVGANPYFKRYTCAIDPGTGINNCGSAQTLTGKIADGVVEWNVSLSNIGATAGEVITASGEGISVVPTASGVFWGLVAFDQAAQDTEYVIPGPAVKVGIAPAGTAPEAVALTNGATLTLSTGAFSSSLPKPAAGSYVVAAQACFGPSSCGLSSTTITV